MKFNWGTGIALFFSLFVGTLLYFVYQSTLQDNSLVSDQYYADDLRYQEHFDKLHNTQSLKEDLKIKTAPTAVELFFPIDLEQISGEIYFFCPSDKSRDFKVNIAPNGVNQQVISTSGLKTGMWRLKVDWSDGTKGYYQEKVIQI